jgi:hypothetical protein
MLFSYPERSSKLLERIGIQGMNNSTVMFLPKGEDAQGFFFGLLQGASIGEIKEGCKISTLRLQGK